jgi:PAS domain S-box-containing protein
MPQVIRRLLSGVDTGSSSALARVRWLFLTFVVVAVIVGETAGVIDGDTPSLLGLSATALLVLCVVWRQLRGSGTVLSWALQCAALAGLLHGRPAATPVALLCLCVLLNAAYTTKRETAPTLAGYAVVLAVLWANPGQQAGGVIACAVIVVILHVGMRSLAEKLVVFDAMLERRTALLDATTAIAGARTEEDVKQVLVVGIAWLVGWKALTDVTLRWRQGELGTVNRSAAATDMRAHIPLLVGEDNHASIDVTSSRAIGTHLRDDILSLGMASVLRLTAINESERFRRLVERSADLITVASADLIVSFHGGAGLVTSGEIREPQVGQPLAELLHPDDFDALLPVLAALLPRQVTAVNLRWWGEHGWRETETVVGNELIEPSVRGYVLNTRDVTERRRLETELRQAQKLEAVGRLSAGIAHEINTPIQFIGDNVRFLADAFRAVDAQSLPGAADSQEDTDRELSFYRAEVPDAIAETIAGVERVATIVSAMRAFGHLDQAHPTSVDVVAALRNTVVVARNEVKDVADVVIEADELPEIVCYISDLNQVFLNLIVNAAHAIGHRPDGDRGLIRIHAARLGTADISIEFSDNGSGIPESLLEKIFEPFFTTKDVGKGTGQGLALARSVIVERHQGRLDVASAVGVGTTFTVVLPIHQGGLSAGRIDARLRPALAQ